MNSFFPLSLSLALLDMRRLVTQFFRQIERNLSQISYQQQRMIQRSTSRLQSVEEVGDANRKSRNDHH